MLKGVPCNLKWGLGICVPFLFSYVDPSHIKQSLYNKSCQKPYFLHFYALKQRLKQKQHIISHLLYIFFSFIVLKLHFCKKKKKKNLCQINQIATINAGSIQRRREITREKSKYLGFKMQWKIIHFK